jgi:hypothetical protein
LADAVGVVDGPDVDGHAGGVGGDDRGVVMGDHDTVGGTAGVELDCISAEVGGSSEGSQGVLGIRDRGSPVGGMVDNRCNGGHKLLAGVSSRRYRDVVPLRKPLVSIATACESSHEPHLVTLSWRSPWR